MRHFAHSHSDGQGWRQAQRYAISPMACITKLTSSKAIAHQKRIEKTQAGETIAAKILTIS